MRVTDHFRLRCSERLGALVDPDALAGLIVTALQEGADDVVRFACKTAQGRRVYRCKVEGKGDVYVLLERGNIALVTVFVPGQIVNRPGKRKCKILRGVIQ
ncbi:hypothetical protein PANO111632_02735 [Paracoccus nototheniae]|uniref:DUF4258 domain-containing protein n=1 Tax=Paracoccus nototheniae TaxID=2489002 RepID=A0ABW4DVG9_9RHOB|nr:hypothetical protein [Paracoccus nototheniae]